MNITTLYCGPNPLEILRITKEGVWANPDIPVDEAAKKVLEAIDHNVKVLIQKAVEEEREHHQQTIDALRGKVEQLKPLRPWVGLTKEEAKEISLAHRPYVIDMIAALEAKLKEKNGG